MGLNRYVGAHAIGTGTGQATITAPGFQPKVGFFMLVKLTADGYSAGAVCSFGAAASATQRFVCSAEMKDNVAQGSTFGQMYGSRIAGTHASGTLDVGIDFVAWTATGLTIDVTVNTPAASYILLYEVLGGTDISNVFVGSRAFPAATGSFNTNAPSFQPTFALFAMGHAQITGTTIVGSAGLCIGAATATEQGAVCFVSRTATGGNTDDANAAATDRCLLALSTSAAPTLHTDASFESFDATGFNLNRITGTVASRFGYVCMAGTFTAKIGQYAMKATTGNQAVTTGNAPLALILVSNRAGTRASPGNSVSWSMGFADGTTQACVSVNTRDAIATSQTGKALNQTRIVESYDVSAETVAESESLVSLSGTDGFTYNQQTAGAATPAWTVMYIALGAASTSAGLPVADAANNGWVNEAAGSSNLYQSVDDGPTPNDADYIISPNNPTGQAVSFTMGPVDPAATSVTLTVRACRSA